MQVTENRKNHATKEMELEERSTPMQHSFS